MAEITIYIICVSILIYITVVSIQNFGLAIGIKKDLTQKIKYSIPQLQGEIFPGFDRPAFLRKYEIWDTEFFPYVINCLYESEKLALIKKAIPIDKHFQISDKKDLINYFKNEKYNQELIIKVTKEIVRRRKRKVSLLPHYT